MSKDLVTFSGFGSPEARESLANTLDTLASSVSDMDGLPLLKLDRKTGEWFFGQEDIPVEDDDLWAVNPSSPREGWIAFDEKAKAIAETEDGDTAEILTPIGQAPSYNELPYIAEPRRGPIPQWKRQIAFELTCIDGPNKGEVVAYKPTSQGGLSALSKLAGEIARRIRSGHEDFVPAIVLKDTSYDHKTWGLTFKPVLEIEAWYFLDDSEVRRKDDEDEDEKPRGRGRGRSKDDEDEDEKPRGRGRSRSKDDEDEDEKPRGRGRSRSKDDEDEDEPRGERKRGRGRR